MTPPSDDDGVGDELDFSSIFRLFLGLNVPFRAGQDGGADSSAR